MVTSPAHTGPDPRHVSLVALPEAVASTLFGLYDVMYAFALMGLPAPGSGPSAPFRVEIVGEAAGPLELASRVPVQVQRAVDTIEASDVVIVPSCCGRTNGRRVATRAWSSGSARCTTTATARSGARRHGCATTSRSPNRARR